MRLMIRWSPISKVFSMEPDGITRACPIVPLISRNARPTQNHAIISRWIFVPTATCVTSCFLLLSAFTFHHHRPFYCEFISGIPVQVADHTVAGPGFTGADFQLYEIRRVNARVTGGAEFPFLVIDRLA